MENAATSLREFHRKQLTDILDSVRGSSKALFLDSKISGPLSLIGEYSLLKDHGIDKIYSFLPDPPESSPCTSWIYLCRPSMQSMKWLSNHIRRVRWEAAQALAQDGLPGNRQAPPPLPQRIDFYLFFVPRRTVLCERVLEEEGVFGDVIVGEYPLDWVPLDTDLLSLEWPHSFRELYLEGDTSVLYTLAKGLMKLQSIYGIIPRIFGKGHYARQLTDLLLSMRKEYAMEETVVIPEIENLIILDRSVDLVTPMVTQLTYEGLIDESLGIQNGFVELDPNLHAGLKEKRRVPLHSSDPVYAQLRDLNFSVVAQILNKTAKQLNQSFEERHQAQTVTELKSFIGKLGNLQQQQDSLGVHTRITEFITRKVLDDEFHANLEIQQNLLSGEDVSGSMAQEHVEERMAQGAPLASVLRILCLHTQILGGFKPKQYDALRLEILQAYGYQHLTTLDWLARTGLFYSTQQQTPTITTARPPLNFAQVRRQLRLFMDTVQEAEPKDISYVYSCYAPLSCRLVEGLLQRLSPSSEYSKFPANPTSCWRGMEDTLRWIPGPNVEEIQRPPAGVDLAEMTSSTSPSPRSTKTTAVLFLGGCCSAEVSALRFLAERIGEGTVLVLTTEMLTGTSLLEELQCKGKSPILIADLLTRPAHSIINQSFDSKLRVDLQRPLNGDGFGVGWYSLDNATEDSKNNMLGANQHAVITPTQISSCVADGPCVFTSILPAWNNLNLIRLSEKIRSRLVFAHVRAASPGYQISETNCHPWTYGRLLWMHNGYISEFRKLKRRLQAELREELFHFVQGNTDSEWVFALFLNQLDDPLHAHFRAEQLQEALLKTIQLLNDWSREAGIREPSLMNFAVSDGSSIVCSRYVNSLQVEPASLFYSSGSRFEECEPGRYKMMKSCKREEIVIVASGTRCIEMEPLTYERSDWMSVPPNTIVVISSRVNILIYPIQDEFCRLCQQP